jgi:sirohydrochlorin cobaltochelatase
MHGVPPKDFPRPELMEFFGLHARLERGHERHGDRGPDERGHIQEGDGPVSRSVRDGDRRDTPEVDPAALGRRYAELDARIRAWPRTSENDPFYVASQALAKELERATGYDVILGFNEFCAPGVDEALDRAAARGPDRVIIITPMVTPGGEHSEVDIPLAISRARDRHRGIGFVYAWPFEIGRTAQFLAAQIALFV